MSSTTNSQQQSSESPPIDLTGMPSSRPSKRTDQSAQPSTQLIPSPTFHVPSVVIPAEAAKDGPAHKIHILGDDARSRFIAHALSGVYDSVSLLGYRKMPQSRYRYVEKVQPQLMARRDAQIEPSQGLDEELASSDSSHIEELVVSGRGFEAVKAVAAVRDRVDENTTICLVNDGLGVLEEIRGKFFKDPESQPKFVLGHMSHALQFNRNRGSVKELKSGRMLLTPADPVTELRDELDMAADRLNMVKNLESVDAFRATSGPYVNWLKFKLPSMVFTAAVEPVCVLLDLPYNGLLNNKSAHKAIEQLIHEMTLLVEVMPEVQGVPELREYVRGQGLRRWCFQRIVGKARAPSDLLKRVEKGLQTDMKYQNGYFVRRAKTLGVPMPMNEMMMQMVRAKRAEAQAKLRAEIPMEETSGAGLIRSRYQQLKPKTRV